MLPHHLWTSGHPPLGKGTIHEEAEGAVYRFKMNLQTDQGRNWHQHLLFDLREGRQPQQAWSYGFKVREGGSTPRVGTRGRLLHAVKSTGEPGAIVVEVSPVTAASQPLGRTLAAKTGGAPLTPRQRADVIRIQRWLDRMLAERICGEQRQAKQLHLAYLQRQIALVKGGLGYELQGNRYRR